MRKVTLIILAICGSLTVNAQAKLGIVGGIPVGDLSDFYTFSLGADFYYMFGYQDEGMIEVGATVGFRNFFGDEISVTRVDDFQVLPVAAVARVVVADFISIGPDVGYAFFLGDGDDSGSFYWRAVAGIDLTEKIELNAFFSRFTPGSSSLGTLGIGVLYDF